MRIWEQKIAKRLALISAIGGALFASQALANPEGGVVSSGAATITSNGKNLNVNQTSNKALIDWRSFDVAPDEKTQFIQPTSSSLTVNRINDIKSSRIDGAIKANGNIVLINQNGIVFGSKSRVDATYVIASTSDISNKNFNNGCLLFDKKGKYDAKIVSNGA